MISVTNRLPVYEVDGKPLEGLPTPAEHLEVRSHWNEDSKVVLEFGGKSLTVSARDLLAAVTNAVNISRH